VRRPHSSTAVCSQAAAHALSALRRSPQGRARTSASVRHDLRRGDAAANESRCPEPQPDENGTGAGGSAHHGAKQKAGLNTSIQDAGWRHFLTILSIFAYTAACAGKRVDAVPPAYTSQDCSGCGKRVRKSLRVRTHVCPSCGLALDRDLNAARTIPWRGQRLRGVAGDAGGDWGGEPRPRRPVGRAEGQVWVMV
jgi:transposase